MRAAAWPGIIFGFIDGSCEVDGDSVSGRARRVVSEASTFGQDSVTEATDRSNQGLRLRASCFSFMRQASPNARSGSAFPQRDLACHAFYTKVVADLLQPSMPQRARRATTYGCAIA